MYFYNDQSYAYQKIGMPAVVAMLAKPKEVAEFVIDAAASLG
jgi:hypothetical protein